MKVYLVVSPEKDVLGGYGSQVLALLEAHALGGRVVPLQVLVEPRGKRKQKQAEVEA